MLKTPSAVGAGVSADVIRVVLLQASRLYRECLSRVLSADDGFEVVAELTGRETAEDDALDLACDAILLDGASLEASTTVSRLLEENPGAKVIACGVPEDESLILACAEAGVSGFVSADCPLREFADTLASACRGELRSPAIAAVLLRAASRRDPGPRGSERPGDPLLTDRESQVVRLIERGLSNKEIASELALGVSTVKHHVHSILHKLKVRRRSQVVARRWDRTI
jgi:DNA-binding NarL/FixJ family response regulator